VDVFRWGAMTSGGSAGAIAHNTPDSTGLNLSVSRHYNAPQFASNSVFVLLPANSCPVQARLRLRTEFDRPDAARLPAPPNLDPATTAPEPWAVALNIKLGGLPDVYQEPMVTVTCQFNRDRDGVRLNTPGSLQRDDAKVMLRPLDYGQYSAKRFVLEHAYGGFNIGTIGHSAGSGALSITGLDPDQRVFSNTGLASGQSIGALGIALVTIDGIGRLSVHLRKFSVEIWD
jgi:hypothetical protein